jgi:hypothetical protein
MIIKKTFDKEFELEITKKFGIISKSYKNIISIGFPSLIHIKNEK